MQIRHAERKDARVLVTLNGVVQRIHAEAHPERFKQPDPEAVLPHVHQWFDAGDGVLIAEIDGVAVGYVRIRAQDVPESAYTHAYKLATLDQIAVLPEHQGAGVGRELIQRAIAWAERRGIAEVQLGVWDFNARAQRAFAAAGFEPMYTMCRRPSSAG